MKKKLFAYSLFLFTVFLLPTLVQAQNLCRWQGYANISGTNVTSEHIISIYNATRLYNATIFSGGLYTADIQVDTTTANISFKICGIDADQGARTWSCPDIGYNTLNISATKLANSASCTYSCGCSGGYCCSGATQYNGTGTGTCQSSACSAGVGGDGGGGGGGAAGGVAAVNVTVVEETKTISVISAGTQAEVTITKSADLKVESIAVSVNTTVNNVQITIKEGSLPSGASAPITADIGSTYKYLEITKNILDSNITKVIIKFKVEKTWINNNSIDVNKISLQRYSGGVWKKLTTTKIKEDATYVYYEAESPGLSLFAITGEKTGVVAEKICPKCPDPSAWSDCKDNKETRTNYKCGSDTNYLCEAYTEEQSCVPEKLPVPISLTKIILILSSIIAVVFIFLKFVKKK